MRIVIEIDGDDVQVHTDRQSREVGSANVVDAGSAPIDLLREHGEAALAAPALRIKHRPIKPSKDTPLNPLRAGQAAARRLRNADAGSADEAAEVVDGGGAPKLPNISREPNTSRDSPQKRGGRKK